MERVNRILPAVLGVAAGWGLSRVSIGNKSTDSGFKAESMNVIPGALRPDWVPNKITVDPASSAKKPADRADISCSLPEWMADYRKDLDVRLMANQGHTRLETPEARMEVAIELSALNVKNGTGGPFGTVITDKSGNILTLAVNRVVPQSSSMFHGETTALMVAQQNIGNFTLSEKGAILTTSAEPCVMCWGSMAWSGISRLEYGAQSPDVERLTGFDEGPKPEDWAAKLAPFGIEVAHVPTQEKAAQAVLANYAKGGVIYNGRDTGERA